MSVSVSVRVLESGVGVAVMRGQWKRRHALIVRESISFLVLLGSDIVNFATEKDVNDVVRFTD